MPVPVPVMLPTHPVPPPGSRPAVDAVPGDLPAGDGHAGGGAGTGIGKRRGPAVLGRAALGALLLACAGFPAQGAPQGGELAERVRELESPDFDVRTRAAGVLERAGREGARAVLDGFERASPAARVLRARSLRLQEDPGALALVLALCGDPSPPVRVELAGYLGLVLRAHPAPDRAALEQAVGALAAFAGGDADGGVRTAALDALARADVELAAAELARLARTSAGAEGALAARALANSPRGGAFVLALVQASFESPGARLDEPALTLLLAEGYGAALAERTGGGLEARERRPFALGERDPSPAVRAASQLAFQGFLGRARFLGTTKRAEEVAAALAGEVQDPAPVLLASAVLGLSAGDDPAPALRALERLRARLSPPRAEDARGRCDLAVALTLSAAAELAAGRPERAAARLDSARALLSGLAAEGLERGGDAGARLAAEVAGERAVVECYALQALLRAGESPESAAAARIARSLHELSLRAQLLATGGALEGWTGDLDSLVHHPHAPFDLLLANPELERRLGANRLDLALLLARALASAAPEELPGFLPAARAPLDPVREGLLGQIEIARLEQVQRELARLPPDAPERTELENALRVLGAELAPEPDLHRVRLPSALAIELAGDLRDEGRTQEAAELATRAKEALSSADFLFGGPYLQELVARAESIVGSCATDEGRPEEADRILNAALERLEAVARSGLDDNRSKAARSNVLVSLAVNANVKLRDPARALEYFERAFDLRQDDFTRTLLACYRARAGRKDEARALLRETPESPFNYYNLACTHALLGDGEEALDFLAREFRAGTKSAGSIERQKVWARTDPDLASLREDPRFRALVGP